VSEFEITSRVKQCEFSAALTKRMKDGTNDSVMPVGTDIIQGDCRDILRQSDPGAFDLIVTSPPYADQRSNTYGGIKRNLYMHWFLERSAEFRRVLKPTGTFILNIKEKAEEGECRDYVLELILGLRKQGWLWTEEFIWHKRNCHPGKGPNRFRDAWERCCNIATFSNLA
jgi:DNA modification methylase